MLNKVYSNSCNSVRRGHFHVSKFEHVTPMSQCSNLTSSYLQELINIKKNIIGWKIAKRCLKAYLIINFVDQLNMQISTIMEIFKCRTSSTQNLWVGKKLVNRFNRVGMFIPNEYANLHGSFKLNVLNLLSI